MFKRMDDGDNNVEDSLNAEEECDDDEDYDEAIIKMKEISFVLIIASSYPLKENEFEIPMNTYLFSLGLLRVCLLFDGTRKSPRLNK